MVTKYTGNQRGITSVQEEDPAKIAARRNRLAARVPSQNTAKDRFLNAGGGRNSAVRGGGPRTVASSFQPTYSRRSQQPTSGGRKLITREMGKKMGMGWKQRTALNKEILGGENDLRTTKARGVNQLNITRAAGANQLANTALSGRNQITQTSMRQKGMDARNKADLSAASERNQATISSANIRNRESIGAADRRHRETLGQKINQFQQGRYDEHMKSATDPNSMTPQTVPEAHEQFRYGEEVREYGPKVASRNATNRQVTEEISIADSIMKTMTPDQRAKYIMSMSPEAQANFEQELQAYQKRDQLRQIIGNQEPPRYNPILQIRDKTRDFINKYK